MFLCYRLLDRLIRSGHEAPFSWLASALRATYPGLREDLDRACCSPNQSSLESAVQNPLMTRKQTSLASDNHNPLVHLRKNPLPESLNQRSKSPVGPLYKKRRSYVLDKPDISSSTSPDSTIQPADTDGRVNDPSTQALSHRCLDLCEVQPSGNGTYSIDAAPGTSVVLPSFPCRVIIDICKTPVCATGSVKRSTWHC